MDEERTDGRVQTLADEPDVGGGGAKEYLDYDGLECLVELLKERIAAVDGDGKYLPLSGGTVTGLLTVNANLYVANNLDAEQLETQSGAALFGPVRLGDLTENADAPNVIVADSTGRLYKAPVSSIAGPDLTAITDAEIDALF